jgi:hypothetical protein
MAATGFGISGVGDCGASQLQLQTLCPVYRTVAAMVSRDFDLITEALTHSASRTWAS